MGQPDVDLREVIRELDSGRTRVDRLSEPAAQALSGRLGLDSDAIQALFDDRAARERNAPGQGGPAPDFELELIDPQGSGINQRRRLSDHLNKPVALIFGSYT